MSQDYIVGLVRGFTCGVSILTLINAVVQEMPAVWIAFVALWTAYVIYRLRLPTNDPNRWI